MLELLRLIDNRGGNFLLEELIERMNDPNKQMLLLGSMCSMGIFEVNDRWLYLKNTHAYDSLLRRYYDGK